MMRFLWKSQLKRERGKFLPKENEQKKKKREVGSKSIGERIALWATVFLWLLFAGTVIYTAIFSLFLKNTDWQVTGLSVVSEEAVRAVVEQELSLKYWGFIPRDTFFMLRTDRLATLLRERYPLLREVTVTRVFPQSLTISIVERDALVLWCTLGVCAHVLESGDTIPVTEVYQQEENRSRSIVLEDGSGQPVRFGTKTFADGYATQIVMLREQLRERFGIATEPTLFFVSRFANEVRMRTGEGWELYFSTAVPIDASLRAFALLYDDEIPKERLRDLSYIDLRTENRIFYRYKENTQAEEVESEPVLDQPAEKKKEKKEKKKD